MGLNPLPCEVKVSIACWPWGSYLGEESLEQGRADEDQLVAAPRSERHAARREDDRHVRQLVVGEGRGDRTPATTRRSCSRRRATCRSAPARTSSSSRSGRIITPPVSAGALEGITQDSVFTIARDLGYEVEVGNILRSDLYTADEAFVTGTAAEVVPILSVDDRVIGDRGPITTAIQAATSKPCAARPIATRTGTNMSGDARRSTPGVRRDLRHDAARRRAARRHLADRRRQAAHRRTARLARRALHRRRLAGLEPKDDEFFRRAATELQARHVEDGRVRLDASQGRQGRQRRHAAPPDRGRHRDGVHRRQELGVPRAQRARDRPRRRRRDGGRLGRVPQHAAAAA